MPCEHYVTKHQIERSCDDAANHDRKADSVRLINYIY